jgi:hypothetical protein
MLAMKFNSPRAEMRIKNILDVLHGEALTIRQLALKVFICERMIYQYIQHLLALEKVTVSEFRKAPNGCHVPVYFSKQEAT